MLHLQRRRGPRPRTAYSIPHRQLDQNPDPHTHTRLLERFLSLPHTTSGQSLISVPGAQALFLCEGPCNEAAFMRGREFAHLHPAADGSFHMMLAPHDLEEVLAQRWGELHPYAASGKAPPNIAMVFGPRDDREIEVTLSIAQASLAYARGN